jgi:NAD(P)-dependent dehydrogenase (short-subunit alcohol dehydrogenase family)
MDMTNQIVVVTGAAQGIGRALALEAKARGAKAVVCVDMKEDAARDTANLVGGIAFKCNVANESDVAHVVAETEKAFGGIDLFCCNAGIGDFGGGRSSSVAAPNESWQRGWDVNVMSHVYAARAALPGMIARKSGYFLNTVSAAGLLNQVGSAVYGVTKHAAVGFAEHLAFTHRDQGIRVSVLCPQGVDTPLLRASGSGPQFDDGVITAEQCAKTAFDGIAKEMFCILPHPIVGKYMQNKPADYDRWIGGMAKLNRAYQAAMNKG